MKKTRLTACFLLFSKYLKAALDTAMGVPVDISARNYTLEEDKSHSLKKAREADVVDKAWPLKIP